jgi:hypothetical protein
VCCFWHSGYHCNVLDFKYPSQLGNHTKIYTKVVIKNCWLVPCQSSVFWCFLVISFLLGITVYQTAFTSYKFNFQIKNSLLYFCVTLHHVEVALLELLKAHWAHVPPVSAFRNSIFHQRLYYCVLCDSEITDCSISLNIGCTPSFFLWGRSAIRQYVQWMLQMVQYFKCMHMLCSVLT